MGAYGDFTGSPWPEADIVEGELNESADDGLCTDDQKTEGYYPVECSCGWTGCSCELEGGPMADTGDFLYWCPDCRAEL